MRKVARYQATLCIKLPSLKTTAGNQLRTAGETLKNSASAFALALLILRFPLTTSEFIRVLATTWRRIWFLTYTDLPQVHD